MDDHSRLGQELLQVHGRLRARVDALTSTLEAGPTDALDGIAAVLANHLAYEERVLVAVLDRLDVAPGSSDDEALRAPLRGVLEPEGT